MVFAQQDCSLKDLISQEMSTLSIHLEFLHPICLLLSPIVVNLSREGVVRQVQVFENLEISDGRWNIPIESIGGQVNNREIIKQSLLTDHDLSSRASSPLPIDNHHFLFLMAEVQPLL